MSVFDQTVCINKSILRELPFYNVNFIKEFNFSNSIGTDVPTLKKY